MVLSYEVLIHELDVAAKLTATVLCMIFAGYFWKRRSREEMKSTRMIFLGQGLFVFCFGLTRFLFVISDYFRTDPIYQNVVIVADEFLFILFWKISALIGILAIIFLLIVIETYLVKSRYVFTIIATAGLILALASPNIEFSRWVTYIAMPVSLIAVVALYIYLLFTSSGEIRKKSGLSVLGLLIMGAGVMLDTTNAKTFISEALGIFPESVPFPVIPIIILTVGIALYTYCNIKEYMT